MVGVGGSAILPFSLSSLASSFLRAASAFVSVPLKPFVIFLTVLHAMLNNDMQVACNQPILCYFVNYFIFPLFCIIIVIHSVLRNYKVFCSLVYISSSKITFLIIETFYYQFKDCLLSLSKCFN